VKTAFGQSYPKTTQRYNARGYYDQCYSKTFYHVFYIYSVDQKVFHNVVLHAGGVLGSLVVAFCKFPRLESVPVKEFFGQILIGL